jgi:hypothetical protein
VINFAFGTIKYQPSLIHKVLGEASGLLDCCCQNLGGSVNVCYKKNTYLLWQNIGLLNRENFITKQLKSGHHYLVRVPYNNRIVVI